MQKPLQDQLADLSVRAREAENAIADARRETRDRLLARREETRAAAAAAADRVEQDLRDAGTALADQWDALKQKVASDIQRFKMKIVERQVERDVQKAADLVARREARAAVAIDYAISSIEDAKLAAIDAVLAKVDAAQTRDFEGSPPIDR